MGVFAPLKRQAASAGAVGMPIQKRAVAGWRGSGLATVAEPQSHHSVAPLPPQLQRGAEALSGFSLADVRVHHNSREPAGLGALAFARGSDIHLAPGQEEHLPHEAWHVVQQKQGRVAPASRAADQVCNSEPGLEAEATAMGRKSAAMAGRFRAPPRLAVPPVAVVQKQDAGAAPAQPVPEETVAPAADANLSGTAWWNANQTSYPNSASLDDLADPFKENARKFVEAMRAGGATVSISSTKRNATRAKLMHYSWQVAKGAVKASDVPAIEGCSILWDHGDEAKSKKGAAEMVSLFGIVHKPSLTSIHIEGRAVDMTISWTGTIEVKDAADATHKLEEGPRNGDNATLQSIGASYSVKKLASDPPHWSDTGH